MEKQEGWKIWRDGRWKSGSRATPIRGDHQILPVHGWLLPQPQRPSGQETQQQSQRGAAGQRDHCLLRRRPGALILWQHECLMGRQRGLGLAGSGHAMVACQREGPGGSSRRHPGALKSPKSLVAKDRAPLSDTGGGVVLGGPDPCSVTVMKHENRTKAPASLSPSQAYSNSHSSSLPQRQEVVAETRRSPAYCYASRKYAQ